MPDAPTPPYALTTGPGPLVAAAVHDGHEITPETLAHVALQDAERLREEDPFTAELAAVAPTQIVGLHSRFEVDLNRPPDRAVYLTPDDAWGLTVWDGDVPDDVVERSRGMYRAFYDALGALLDGKVEEHGAVVVYDLHSYNHRRDGPDGPAADDAANPEVNIGTGTLDRSRWGHLVDGFMADLRSGARDAGLGDLDVRENVKFQGGYLSQWIHERYGSDACVLAVEFKKTFMDEWSGTPDRPHLDALRKALQATVPGTLLSLDAATS